MWCVLSLECPSKGPESISQMRFADLRPSVECVECSRRVLGAFRVCIKEWIERIRNQIKVKYFQSSS